MIDTNTEKRIKRILVKLAEVVDAECGGSAEHISEHFDANDLLELAKELDGNIEIPELRYS